MRGRTRVVAAAAVVLLAALATVAGVRLLGDGAGGGADGRGDDRATGDRSTDLADADSRQAAEEFFATYVEADGRVVRTDQGGDTVSEGQAYGMLIAAATGDRDGFDRVWQWTQDELLRDDGLLSWRWDQGAVVDESSATDADLDAARALVVAAEVFDDPDLRDQGVALGDAILDHATARTPDGLVLVAGQWATTSPYAFNPSYVSPAATAVLAEASGDARWTELDAGSRAAIDQLVADGLLPADWAQVAEDGGSYPVEGPNGEPVQFGYDGARTLLRHAESCAPDDRELAADLVVLLGAGEAVATYDIGGGPTTEDGSPLMSVAQAAGLAAGEDADGARTAIDRALAEADTNPTYYGDAWAVLGPLMLTDDALGGCPPLEAA
ncbi:glycosyl hydrolase family 8 [Nocardioides alkalitolerans]|uniref:glycosyl hydrolase family 8 n=1 Tax=Nocardioides alkalitolerans TaxID=281714 RepID=UPI0003F98223|nr:glycosyl hydrolase family 8 [Nocardioides alkalitolerans]